MGLIPCIDEMDAAGFDAESADVREWYAMNEDLRDRLSVWIATRRDEFEIRRRDGSAYRDEDGNPLTARVYHIQGIFSTEEAAAAACRDETYLIGSLPLNLSLPHDPVPWQGSYKPKARPLPFWHEMIAR